MPTFDTASISLIAITLLAATVNGGLGYGFSSLTVPVALLFYTNRVLNPTMVIVEVAINLFVLLMNMDSLPRVYKRVWPIVVGLVPGVLLGSYMLSHLHPSWIKFFTYSLLLPLIFLQAAGIRRPLQAERAIGLPFGASIGFLYSVTTISGPPLAVLFNNQGLVKKDFRAALGLIRVAESSMTAIAYFHLGLFNKQSMALVPLIVPSVVVGIPPWNGAHSPHGSGDVSPHLYELRRLGRVVRAVAGPRQSEVDPSAAQLLGDGGRDDSRRLPPLQVLHPTRPDGRGPSARGPIATSERPPSRHAAS